MHPPPPWLVTLSLSRVKSGTGDSGEVAALQPVSDVRPEKRRWHWSGSVVVAVIAAVGAAVIVVIGVLAVVVLVGVIHERSGSLHILVRFRIGCKERRNEIEGEEHCTDARIYLHRNVVRVSE